MLGKYKSWIFSSPFVFFSLHIWKSNNPLQMVVHNLLYFFVLRLSFPMPHLHPRGIFGEKEAIWDVNILYFHPPVLQEEILPSGPAGRWILQPQLLQGREHLQGTQRNHLPWLMHGGCSGKGPHALRPLKPQHTVWILVEKGTLKGWT